MGTQSLAFLEVTYKLKFVSLGGDSFIGFPGSFSMICLFKFASLDGNTFISFSERVPKVF